MSLPPFPQQDLAKLVLGYLAEEQCMTAHDEFLNSSPYLDAYRNEYDSILMASLKQIVSEYRALKIYIRNCKPIALRKILLQCQTLLDVGKVFVSLVDSRKLSDNRQAFAKTSLDTHNAIPAVHKPNEFEVCKTCNRDDGCVCKTSQQVPSALATPYRTDLQEPTTMNTVPLASLVETTSLEDLPGNNAPSRRRSLRTSAEKNISPADSKFCSTCDSGDRQFCSSAPVASLPVSTLALEQAALPHTNNSSQNRQRPVNSLGQLDCPDKKQVLKDIVQTSKGDYRPGASHGHMQQGDIISSNKTFQEFASSVKGGNTFHLAVSMPDSSTPEASSYQSASACKSQEKFTELQTQSSLIKLQLNSHLIKAVQKNISENKDVTAPVIQQKCDEPKVTILSNDVVQTIKEEGHIIVNKLNGEKSQIRIAHSTADSSGPIQTILINGTPAYKERQSQKSRQLVFSKDEIMAMPTVIVLQPPVSGGTQTTVTENVKKECNIVLKASKKKKCYQPLTVEVGPAINIGTTVESVSVPTELPTISSSLQKSKTPQLPRPIRKSSSTPRRTSHVRVLDFTTPRRILHGGLLAENALISQTVGQTVPLSVAAEDEIINSSSDINAPDDKLVVVGQDEIKKSLKKTNWDAELRALAISSVPQVVQPRPKKVRKKPPQQQQGVKSADTLSEVTNKSNSKKAPVKIKLSAKEKSKKSKKAVNAEGLIKQETKLAEPLTEPSIVPLLKPAIHITSERKDEQQDMGKKLQQVTDHNKTPEMDHAPVMVPLSAKLNISEFLETPYKQALYDIQMETPQFGRMILDEPISDIKIMNIPTPKFLDTPNFSITPIPKLATPSSYSSRPTDYSSGGSYYRPDDHDYEPATNILQNVTTSSPIAHSSAIDRLTNCSSKSNNEVDKNLSNQKSSRPVRQCTLRVSSYYVGASSTTKEQREEPVSESHNSSSSTCSTCSGSPDETICDVSVQESSILCEGIVSETIKSSSQSNKHTNVQTNKLKGKENSTLVRTKKSKSPQKSTTPRLSRASKSKTRISNSSSKKKSATKPRKTFKRRSQDSSSRSALLRSNNKKKGNSKEKLVSSSNNATPAAPKSRRKSSTPRKLHCSNEYNASSKVKNYDDKSSKSDHNMNLDSETDISPLHWSDNGSQDSKPKEFAPHVLAPENDTDEMVQIKEYMKNSQSATEPSATESLHVDLIQRGFDIETARRIERDLLDIPADIEKEKPLAESTKFFNVSCDKNNHTLTAINKNINLQTVEIEGNFSSVSHSEDHSKTLKNLSISSESVSNMNKDQGGSVLIEKTNDIELSHYECNEDTANYLLLKYDNSQISSQLNEVRLKDNYSMEVWIEDSTKINVRASSFQTLFDEDFTTATTDTEGQEEMSITCDTINKPLKSSMTDIYDQNNESIAETAAAVHSISNMERLYTPQKILNCTIQRHCLELFDSTLNSLDTPLKVSSPRLENPSVVSPLIIDVETSQADIAHVLSSEISIPKKRKRIQGGSLSDESDTKKSRPDMANIQNFDIESVLSKLHGP